jgi:uncharacterized protein (UPF0548 family)
VDARLDRAGQGRVAWARTGEYYCEIKTGNASFERSQVAVMKELAKQERVLKIWGDIDDLSEQYSLQIREVAPSE